jgi:hypothetical protein
VEAKNIGNRGTNKKIELSDQEEDRSQETEAEGGTVGGKGQSDSKYVWAPQPPDDAGMDLPQVPTPRPQGMRLPGRGGPAQGQWATSTKTYDVKIDGLTPPDEREEEGDKEYLDEVTHDEEHAQTQARDNGRKQKGQQHREEHESTQAHKQARDSTQDTQTTVDRPSQQDTDKKGGEEDSEGQERQTRGEVDGERAPHGSRHGEAGRGNGDPQPGRAHPPWRFAPKGGSPGDRRRENPECLGGQAWKADPHWK